MEQKSKPPRIKIISVGNMKVGKSCLIKKYCEKNRSVSNYIPTIGVDYGVKATTTKFNGGRISEVKIDFFDFSGEHDRPPTLSILTSVSQSTCVLYVLLHKDFFSLKAIPTILKSGMNSTIMSMESFSCMM
mmetsp:Transcript_24410/g.48550  ORF Transcript_24410/g.48550 Transcript_24410/m.48550 type:complete len:131 (-) Transcript_24410:150-542(-)